MAVDDIRIRLDFTDLQLVTDNVLPSCWMSVDKVSLLNIVSLKENIKSRFLSAFNVPNYNLHLLGCLLPDSESTHVLRENDIICLVPISEKNSPQTTGTKNKKRKRKRSQQASSSILPAEESSNISIQEAFQELTNESLAGEKVNTNVKKKQKKSDDSLNAKTQDVSNDISSFTKTVEPNVPQKQDPNSVSEMLTPNGTIKENDSKIFEIAELVGDAQVLENNTSPTMETKPKKRRRRARKKKSLPIQESFHVPFEKQPEDPTPSANHVFFTDDNFEMLEHKNSLNSYDDNDRNSVATSPYCPYVDMCIPKTILPASKMKYEDTCNDLLRMAQNEKQHNTSIFLVNCANGDSPIPSPGAIKKVKTEEEYLSLPPLLGSPRVGDCIAYRILELSDKFIPELSGYKEAKVVGFDSALEMVTLDVRVGMIQRTIKDVDGGYDTVIYDDVLNVTNPSEKIVKVQLSHMNQPKLMTE